MSVADMKSLTERIRIEIQETAVDVGGKFPLKITVSAGVSGCDSASARSKTPQDLFRSSDALLYLAKNSGRNNVKCQGDM